ncbi:MAG TPA: 1-(5-phosphoribosyl)-5-[(5-phosphoribosylamino)methylideneamino] imidazole-4-carboxamide isomerase [Polyangiaceae bacterium]|jgi:phosphoribosylformimino-5-aminoimidazole carboxamide ribotide isomerase
MILCPAIDLLGGKAVRLHQGKYDQVTVFDEDPPARARGWSGRAARLHVVDLEGARAGEPVQKAVVRAIADAFRGPMQVGGGVRTRAAFEGYLALGADRVVLGTAAVRDPELVRSLAIDHPGKVVLAVDAKDGWVATDGWEKTSQITAIDLARSFAGVPIGALLYTDVARDGTRVGPNVEATARLARDSGFPVIASGGVGALEHLRSLAEHPGIESAIVGRAIYDGAFSLEDGIAAAAGAR